MTVNGATFWLSDQSHDLDSTREYSKVDHEAHSKNSFHKHRERQVVEK